jgi:hypothetical protein
VTGRKDYEGHAAVSAGSHETPGLRWNTLPEAKNQSTAGKGVIDHGAEKESNGSCTRTEWAPWKRRNVTKGSGAVLVAGNVSRRQRLGESVRAVREESTSTV